MATETTEVVTLTVALTKGSETQKTVRFYEADEDGKANQKGSALLWVDKSILENLGDAAAADLTVTISAVKSEPGIVRNPPLEDTPEPAEVDKSAGEGETPEGETENGASAEAESNGGEQADEADKPKGRQGKRS